MRKNLFTTRCLTALSYALLSFYASAETIQVSLSRPSLRSEAPVYHLTDASGKAESLADYRGKVVLLNFWATECGGCRLELPWLVELHDTFRNAKVAVIGVSLDLSYEGPKSAAEAWAILKPFAKAHQITYPILMGNDEMSKQYDINALPATYLIDSRGRVAAKYIGLIDEENVKRNIDILLAEGR